MTNKQAKSKLSQNKFFSDFPDVRSLSGLPQEFTRSPDTFSGVHQEYQASGSMGECNLRRKDKIDIIIFGFFKVGIKVRLRVRAREVKCYI